MQAMMRRGESFKVLSLHEGLEYEQMPEDHVINRFRRAQFRADLDLIIAHHSHVVRGLEMDVKGRVIAYGLGNGMLHGAVDISERGSTSDFGLMLRLYYRRSAMGPVLEALEAIPLTSVHRAPRPMTPSASKVRIRLLNVLSRETSNERALELKNPCHHRVWLVVSLDVANPSGHRSLFLIAQPRRNAHAQAMRSAKAVAVALLRVSTPAQPRGRR